MPTASSRTSALRKIQVLNGRYGPYVTDKLKNARVPKDRDPKTLTLEECQALLAAAPAEAAAGPFGRPQVPAAEGRGGRQRGNSAAPRLRAGAAAPAVKTKKLSQAKPKAKAKAKVASKAPAAGKKATKRG